MEEDESGDLKTPLKQRYFIEIIQFAFRNLILEMTFQIRAYNSIIIETCVKKRVIYFYLELFLKLVKREKKKFEWEQKNKAKEGWNKRKRRGRKRESKEEVKNKKREE